MRGGGLGDVEGKGEENGLAGLEIFKPFWRNLEMCVLWDGGFICMSPCNECGHARVLCNL